jgi:predicted nucleic acid-binding protein
LTSPDRGLPDVALLAAPTFDARFDDELEYLRGLARTCRDEARLIALCDALSDVWRRVFEPLQETVHEVLTLELESLSRQLAIRDAHHAILARLGDPTIPLKGAVPSASARPTRRPGDARLLTLIPVVAATETALTGTRGVDEMIVAYPAPGAWRLWHEAVPTTFEALSRVLGVTRARVLLAVQTPSTTKDVANQLAVSATLISHHLSALRRQHLIAGDRFGRRVHYRLTPRGCRLRDALAE